jgi:hypothetical protein
LQYTWNGQAWVPASGGGGSAATVTFAPAGNVAATNVQAAVVELDNEKVAKAGDTMTGHLSLPTSPAAANAVRKDYVDTGDTAAKAYTPSGNIAANTVQAAIAELDTEKVAKAGDTMTGHLSLPTTPAAANATRKDYVDAGDTAAKAYTPSGNIAANTVQAAIAELDAEKVAKAGDTMTGDLVIAKANPGINLNKPASGSTNYINGMTNSLRRWALVLGNNGTEGALNVGSDFVLSRHDNAGNWIEDPVVIDRSSGLITIAHDPVNPMHVATKQYVDAGVRSINYVNSTAYTFVLSDTGRLVLLNNTSQLAMTATMPPNSAVAFPIGAQIDLGVTMNNSATLVPDTGVTFYCEDNKRKLPKGGSCATLVKIGTDIWLLSGSLIA